MRNTALGIIDNAWWSEEVLNWEWGDLDSLLAVLLADCMVINKLLSPSEAQLLHDQSDENLIDDDEWPLPPSNSKTADFMNPGV